MSDKILEAAKFSLLGAVVGSTAAFAGDFVYSKILVAIGNPNAGTAGQLSNAAVGVLVASTSLGVAMYLGEEVMQRFGAMDDPLVGTIFYQTLFTGMAASSVTPRVVRTLIQKAINGNTPRVAPVVAETGVSAGAGASCASGSCGKK